MEQFGFTIHHCIRKMLTDGMDGWLTCDFTSF